MSKLWYPVINESECVSCGACVEKCRNGVYDKSKAPKPVVIFPEGCVDGCHGCGNLCPSQAIQYFGDSKDASNCECGCDCSCEGGNCG